MESPRSHNFLYLEKPHSNLSTVNPWSGLGALRTPMPMANMNLFLFIDVLFNGDTERRLYL